MLNLARRGSAHCPQLRFFFVNGYPLVSFRLFSSSQFFQSSSNSNYVSASSPSSTDELKATTTSQQGERAKLMEQTSSSTKPVPESAEMAYAPWEIRALILPLLSPYDKGTLMKEILYLLPKAAARQLQSYPGGPMAFIAQHFSDDIVIINQSELKRKKIAEGDAKVGNTQAPPPPPPPPFATTASGAMGGELGGLSGGGPKTTIQILDELIDYLPTFFVPEQIVEGALPENIKKYYAETSFRFFLKRFKHYIDVRTRHGMTDIRLRSDFAHPKRGLGDARYRTGNQPSGIGEGGNSEAAHFSAFRRPPRNSEANLILFIVPRMPTTYTPLATVLQDISDIISRHPSFDPRLGVTGLLEKYPEFFQITDGKLRIRPYRSAPNSVDDLSMETSPLPDIYAKIKKVVDAAAEGKNFMKEDDKKAATVSTARLFSLLTAPERAKVKTAMRSFPRFLRAHGKEIAVSVDNMRVHQFRPEYERCAETLINQRLLNDSLSPDDPVLKIPSAMSEDSDADWAVKELYDSLPLMQCAELQEILSLVPPAVRTALPGNEEDLTALLKTYSDYFMTWPYPDDTSVIVIQRAKLEHIPVSNEEILRMVIPLIPPSGIDVNRLMRRVPLQLQRYFYLYGLKVTLSALDTYFRIEGDTIFRVE